MLLKREGLVISGSGLCLSALLFDFTECLLQRSAGYWFGNMLSLVFNYGFRYTLRRLTRMRYAPLKFIL